MRTAFLFAILTVGAGSLSAGPIPPDCTPGTLGDYISLSDGCLIGINFFTNFGAMLAGPFTPDSILVKPTVRNGNPSFVFSSALFHGPRAAEETIEIDFDKEVFVGPPITDGLKDFLVADLFPAPQPLPDTVTTTACFGELFEPDGTCTAFETSVTVSDQGPKLDRAFSPMVYEVGYRTTVDLQPSGPDGGFKAFSITTMITPEPSSFALAAGAFGALAMLLAPAKR